MAAASLITTSMAAVAMKPKIQSSLHCNNSSLSVSYQFHVNYKPTFKSSSKTKLFGASLNPRCECILPDDDDDDDNGEEEAGLCDKGPKSRVSSKYATQQLNTLGADRYTKEKTSIVVLGLNIHTAPVEMREKLAIQKEKWGEAVSDLCTLNHIEEAAVLSTCNRMEIYVLALSWHRGVREVKEWMAKIGGISASELHHHLFLLRDSDATQHLFEVSSGLDSLILGEGQILAQVKQVLKSGEEVKGFGRNIGDLFKGASKVGKRVRKETGIASGAVSVSSAAVDLAIRKLLQHSSAMTRMLIIGAGDMAELVIKHLVSKGWTKMVVVNRTEKSVANICEKFKGVEIIYRPFTEMLTCAAEADVVFTCTYSECPLFSKENVEALPPASLMIGGSRIFVDISVPRNVSSCVSEVEHAQLYNIDDLNEVVAANKDDRRRKAMGAQAIIAEETKKFENERKKPIRTIKKLRVLVASIRTTEVERYFSKMGDDVTEKMRETIKGLCLSITDKVIHGPTKHLRCDGSENRTLSETLENMYALNRMYNLETDPSLLGQKV